MLNDPSFHLVPFDGLEQGLEVAFAESLIALALDDLKKYRADHRLRKDLLQQARTLPGRAIDEDLIAL